MGGGGEVVAPAPPRPRPTHLDHLPAIHLHELAQVLLQQVGVGAPLEEAQQVHWNRSQVSPGAGAPSARPARPAARSSPRGSNSKVNPFGSLPAECAAPSALGAGFGLPSSFAEK